MGIGLEYEPTYAGSDEYSTEADAFARTFYRNTKGQRFYLSLGEIGILQPLPNDMQFQAFIEYEEGREVSEDDTLQGLNEVDSTFEGQFILAKRFHNVSVFGVLQPDLTGDANKGLVWFIGATFDHLLAPNWRMNSRVDVSGGNREYMQTEFGITKEETMRTNFDAYTPDAGLKSTTVSITSEFYFTKQLSLLGTIELEHYFSEAADSPLIRDEGSKSTVEAGVLLRYQF
ncbi:MipA/OmpV family protein [Agarilytica rhodophyticola]|uniref:MipA/OmpV family protein n=1 Tax=Agarilytica rhodophyticola TaxID=1737490 RepID=UPI000B3410CD